MDELYTQLLESCLGLSAAGGSIPTAGGSVDEIVHALGGMQIGATRPPHSPLRYRPFSFDIESTGLSTKTARIIELAIVDVPTFLALDANGQDSGRGLAPQIKAAHWSSLVNPQGQAIDYFATKCHGIRTCDVTAPGVPNLHTAWRALTTFVEDALAPGERPLLIAHNGFTFDFVMLRNNLRLFDLDVPPHWLGLDTLVMVKVLRLKEVAGLGSLQQGALVEHFLGAAPVEAHRALADAQQLALVLPHLLRWAADAAGHLLEEKLLPRKLTSFALKPPPEQTVAAAADGLQLQQSMASSSARASGSASIVRTISTGAAGSSGVASSSSAASSSGRAVTADGAASTSITEVDPLPYFLTINSAGRQPQVVEALRPQRFAQLVDEPAAIVVDIQCLARSSGMLPCGGVCFADVRLARSGGPVAVLLEGAKLSKAITKQCYYMETNGSLSSLKLHLQLDRHQEELAAAVDALGGRAADVCPGVRMSSCQNGTGKKLHLQVSLGCTKQPNPVMSTVIGHAGSSSRERRVLPAMSLTDGAAALEVLQRLFPRGSRCDAVVSPSCVWVNGSKGGVALKLLEAAEAALASQLPRLRD